MTDAWTECVLRDENGDEWAMVVYRLNPWDEDVVCVRT